ncbi:MAG: hypothetical protein FWG80_03690 [Alphaproteobacteria bacterium]|nr:hypothetical protein [Alphaproteobacteria bacterium]
MEQIILAVDSGNDLFAQNTFYMPRNTICYECRDRIKPKICLSYKLPAEKYICCMVFNNGKELKHLLRIMDFTMDNFEKNNLFARLSLKYARSRGYNDN